MAHAAAFVLTMGLLAGGRAGAAELSYAHYAPGAGPVNLFVDREPAIALAYRDFLPVRQIDAGLHTFQVQDADGNDLAIGQLRLRATDRYVMMLAGNGTDAAPFQLRVSIDHNQLLEPGQFSLQSVNLAIAPADGSALAGSTVSSDCNGAVPQQHAEFFGFGSAPLQQATQPASNLEVATDLGPCRHSLAPVSGADAPVETVFDAQPGERLRRFAIGDGIDEPYEIFLVSQGIEPYRPVVPASGAIEGLWSIVGEPNSGLQVAYDGAAAPDRRVSAVFFGYDSAGSSTWRTLQPHPGMQLLVAEYLGGNLDGTRAAVGFDRGDARLYVHSCREMTLTLGPVVSTYTDGVFPTYPRSSLTLRRLFPTVCPPASGMSGDQPTVDASTAGGAP